MDKVVNPVWRNDLGKKLKNAFNYYAKWSIVIKILKNVLFFLFLDFSYFNFNKRYIQDLVIKKLICKIKIK